MQEAEGWLHKVLLHKLGLVNQRVRLALQNVHGQLPEVCHPGGLLVWPCAAVRERGTRRSVEGLHRGLLRCLSEYAAQRTDTKNVKGIELCKAGQYARPAGHGADQDGAPRHGGKEATRQAGRQAATVRCASSCSCHVCHVRLCLQPPQQTL